MARTGALALGGRSARRRRARLRLAVQHPLRGRQGEAKAHTGSVECWLLVCFAGDRCHADLNGGIRPVDFDGHQVCGRGVLWRIPSMLIAHRIHGVKPAGRGVRQVVIPGAAQSGWL